MFLACQNAENSCRSDDRPVVGLMGGICSGKTTVAEIFEKNGFLRIDADAETHELLGKLYIKKSLREVFGDTIFDHNGEVNRGALADIVFEDENKLLALTSIIHPPVIGVIEQRLTEESSPAVLDAALLVETGLDRRFCTFLIFVDRPFSERLALAVEKRGWGSDELRRREAMQIPAEKKREKSDMVLSNRGSLDELERAVREVIDRIK